MPFSGELFQGVLVIVLALGTASAMVLTGRLASPVISILARWLRWFLLAALSASLIRWFDWSGLSFSVLFAVAFLSWFVLEGLYHWIAISAISRSQLPLFPSYQENPRKADWPSHPRFIRLKNWLRENGWVREQSLFSVIHEDIAIRLFAFRRKDGPAVRLNVVFMPFGARQITACYSLTSYLPDDRTLVTDNMFLPFGGFYPESWYVERRPLMRRIEQLWQRHLSRLDAIGESPQPLVLEPLQQISEDSRKVERLNRELGFLHQSVDEEEMGRLTGPGKARLWQEWWLLAYLGRSLKYS